MEWQKHCSSQNMQEESWEVNKVIGLIIVLLLIAIAEYGVICWQGKEMDKLSEKYLEAIAEIPPISVTQEAEYVEID